MQLSKSKSRIAYKIVASDVNKNGELKEYFINRKRVLIGRSSACDIVIKDSRITAIHSVIEVSNDDTFRIYDMHSTNGTYVNGNRVISEDFNLGDIISFGTLEYSLKKVDSASSDKKSYLSHPILPETFREKDKAEVPRIVYPLSKDSSIEYSEYIFEDIEHLYPIFDYSNYSNAVEVIIIFNDRILSIDYVTPKIDKYFLAGFKSKEDQLEYPYLAKKDVIPFIEFSGDTPCIISLNGYKVNFISSNKQNVNQSSFLLGTDDIINFKNNDIEIFVRNTISPPKVDSPPFFRLDNQLKKLIIIFLLLGIMFTGIFTWLIEVDKEIEKEKIPERIATILYKSKLTVSKNDSIVKQEDKPKEIIQKAPSMKIEKPTAIKKVEKKVEKSPPKKQVTKPITQPKKQVSKPKPAKSRKNNINTPTKIRNAKKKANTKGRIDAFKADEFKSNIKKLLAKGGNIGEYKVKQNQASIDEGSNIDFGVSNNAKIKKAQLDQKVGKFSDVVDPSTENSSTSDIISKKKLYTPGLLSKTVILGGADPDVIRRILIQNIPRFRYCYNKVLDTSRSAISGIVRFNFVIGASGHVTKASARGGLTASIRTCVVNVLRGIKFPEQPGGGVVEVNQPMNFYPTKN